MMGTPTLISTDLDIEASRLGISVFQAWPQERRPASSSSHSDAKILPPSTESSCEHHDLTATALKMN